MVIAEHRNTEIAPPTLAQLAEAALAASEARTEAQKITRRQEERRNVTETLYRTLTIDPTLYPIDAWTEGEAGHQIAVIGGTRFRCVWDLEALVRCPDCGKEASKWVLVDSLKTLGWYLRVAAQDCHRGEGVE